MWQVAFTSRGDSEGSYTYFINPFANSFFADEDDKEKVEESSMKRTGIESARDDRMAAYVYDCHSAAVTYVVILPDLQN